MNDELQTLWALHGLDERLLTLQAALARFPTQRQTVELRLTGDRTRLEALKKQLGEYQGRRRQMEQSIEALLAEERKFQNQLPLVKKNQEYTALLHEIGGVRQLRSDRETELLTLMDDEERCQGERPLLEQALAAAQAETAERLTTLGDQEREEIGRVAAVEAERAELISRLTVATRSRYERIRASKEGRAVVPIQKGACGGCFRGQPPQVIQEARRADRLITCDGCGRLLVWPPDTAG